MPHSIRTETLLLRQTILRDAPGLARALNHFDVTRQTGTLPYPLTAEILRPKLPGWSNDADKGMFGFTILFGMDIAGHLSLGRRQSGDWDIGYSLSPDYWGQGLGTEAARALCGFGFRMLKIRSVLADVFTDNPGSTRVLEKMGFRPTTGRADAFSIARGYRVPVSNFVLQRERFRPDAS